MALPADFNKIFGSTATGGLTPIGDVNYAKGWEFVGSNPPTKNDFSYLQNLSDLKSQWLYSNKLQRTDPFGDIKSDGTVETALENLSLGTAAKKDVGTGTGQIPDMSSFVSNGAQDVFSSIVIAGNRRIMEGSGSGNFVNGVLSFTLPLAYPSTGFTFIPTDVGSGVVSYAATPESGSVVTIYGKDAAGANLNGSFSFKYINCFCSGEVSSSFFIFVG